MEAEEISGAVMSQLAASLKPHVGDVELHIEGVESIELAPFPLPPLFDGELVTLFAHVAGGEPTTVMVAGNVGDRPFELCAEVVPDMHIGCGLDKQFAYAAIRDLEQRFIIASDEEKKTTGQRIIELSLEHQILSMLSTFWSFVLRKPNLHLEEECYCEFGLLDENIHDLITPDNPLWGFENPFRDIQYDTDDPFQSDRDDSFKSNEEEELEEMNKKEMDEDNSESSEDEVEPAAKEDVHRCLKLELEIHSSFSINSDTL